MRGSLLFKKLSLKAQRKEKMDVYHQQIKASGKRVQLNSRRFIERVQLMFIQNFLIAIPYLSSEI